MGTADSWAERLIASLTPVQQQELATKPFVAIPKHFDLKIAEARPGVRPRERGAGGQCDGMSFLDQGLVVYVPADPRRENFTILHELGHYLVADVRSILNWIQNQPNPARAEEEVCDRVAAALLLPASKVEEVCGEAAVRARHLFELYKHSGASSIVCAIEMARRLGCPGFIALINRGGWVVTFASRRGDTTPYAWRGDIVPESHPLRSVAPQSTSSQVAWWPQGSERPEYFMDATAAKGQICALFATRNLWGIRTLGVLDRGEERDQPTSTRFYCTSCHGLRYAWPYRCTDCGELRCRHCEACKCTREAEYARATCRGCFQKVPPRRIEGDLCDECRARGRPPR